MDEISRSAEVHGAFLADLRVLSPATIASDEFAQALYAALCNMRWEHRDHPKVLVSVSWRRAGEIVAELRMLGEGYTDFYCSGIGGKGVPEGVVTKAVKDALGELGWHPVTWPLRY
jgi:hypothetical protein